jgi:hypothetical protein
MEMIDSNSLFYTAHRLLRDVAEQEQSHEWTFRKIDVQDLRESDYRKYTLMVCVKPNPGNSPEFLQESQEINKEQLLAAAHELINAEPKPTGFEFFKKDVQEFSDSSGKKYVLGLAFKGFDNDGKAFVL